MRIGGATSGGHLGMLGDRVGAIQGAYRDIMAGLVEASQARVMLGDSSVTEQATFDPAGVEGFYGKVLAGLDGWDARPVTTTGEEDLRRIFTKFEVREGRYLLSGHMSVQYHVLLYYRPDYRVVKCQKELAEIVKREGSSGEIQAGSDEEAIVSKLREMGYGEMGHEELFKLFYENDELRESVYHSIEGGMSSEAQEMAEKKKKLLAELDGLLIETYQTTSVMIDDARLVSGEEGILCTFDLEFDKDGTKEGAFDTKRISKRVLEGMASRLDEFLQSVRDASRS